jgi:2Fe-2S ferredoxin
MISADMGGTNPFIQDTETRLPTRKFTITFQPEGQRVEVDPARIPYGRDGKPGSILDIALAHDIDLDHACGGVCACSTCHVLVRQGLETCNEATDDELDQLDKAPGLETCSRLGCQCVPDGTRDMVVEIPNWNRNLVGEH